MVPPRGELRELSDRELVLAFQSAHIRTPTKRSSGATASVSAVCASKMLRDPHDAEEATQETFLRGYKALGRFNGRYQLGAWLARIATNVCLDEIRKTKTHVTSAPIGMSRDSKSSIASPSDLVVERTEVERSMGEIAPLTRALSMLQAVEGMSHKEMAGELEMTAPQVKSLLHRARRSFRAAWQEASGWLIAPLPAFRSLLSRDESQPAGDVTAGATLQLSSAFVERLATGTVAAVIAIGGLLGRVELRSSTRTRVTEPGPTTEKDSGGLEASVRKGARRDCRARGGPHRPRPPSPPMSPRPPSTIRSPFPTSPRGCLRTTTAAAEAAARSTCPDRHRSRAGRRSCPRGRRRGERHARSRERHGS